MTITYRTPDSSEIAGVIAAGELPFGDVAHPEDVAFYSGVVEPERVIVAEEGGRIVGVGAALSYDLSVPGGDAVPLCGVGLVSVLPTHRRRGVASALLRQQHADAVARGEPLVGLMASESRIYGRFGYGIASHRADSEIATAHAALRTPVDVAGRVRFVEPGEAGDLTVACLKALRASTPGIPGGADARLRGRLQRDPEHWRDGAGARMLVAYEDRGLLAYRVKADWQPTGPAHTLLVTDLYALDDEALTGLWAYCLDLDLVATVRTWFRPVDEPLAHLLVDPRRLSTTVSDALWLRILDVPTALAGRRYDADGTWLLHVDDAAGLAQGTYRLEVRNGRAEVRPAPGRPDVTLPVDSLAAAYLGGTRLSGLARAGRVDEHTPGSVRSLDRALAWDPLPWTPFEI